MLGADRWSMAGNRRTTLAIAGAVCGLVAFTPAKATAAAMTIKGSDTMVVLGQRWAEEYMKKNPKAMIQVTGGGSGTGISALINGTTDICEASRSMKDVEKKQLAEKAGAPPIETPVARDGLSVYVNDANPINELTMAQLKGDLHGQGQVVEGARRSGRGNHPLFAREQLRHVRLLQGARPRQRGLHAPSASDAGNGGGRQRRRQGEVRNRLRRRRLREGHQGHQSEEGRSVAGVAPSDATIKNGTYPLSRPLFFYTRAKPSPTSRHSPTGCCLRKARRWS